MDNTQPTKPSKTPSVDRGEIRNKILSEICPLLGCKPSDVHPSSATMQTIDAILKEFERQDTGYTLLSKSVRRPKLDENTIIFRNGLVQFGQFKPAYEYLHIHYDQTNKRIKFSEGNTYDKISYKVTRNKASGSYSMRSRALGTLGVLPDGVYRQHNAEYFELTRQQSEAEDGL